MALELRLLLRGNLLLFISPVQSVEGKTSTLESSVIV